MGSSVSKETMSNFVANNNEIAYNCSETEEEYIYYFKKEATYHGIDMTDEDNIQTLNDILRSYINDFNNRKEYERKKKEERQSRREKRNLKEEKKNQIIKDQSQMIKNLTSKLEDTIKINMTNKVLIERLKNDNQKEQNESKRREENQTKIIHELRNQQKLSNEENKKREKEHLELINEFKNQQQKYEEEIKEREIKHLAYIEEINSQRIKAEEESKRREEMKII